MSYAASAVAYWVGQANDFSTGSHPTGWTNGQRWSETAEEWRLMAVNASGTAIDTSTGRHPVGWSSGQYWSETAAEWMAMYDTEFTNARDTSAGQTNKPSGLAHPTGWSSNQFWSATATQWNTMWGIEWNAARDPQGQEASYPGQAANAVYWSQSAQYWKDQADYYWGPNRVWSSGSTWESQANYYWGPSRTWNNGVTFEAQAWTGGAMNNGELWSTAYNREYTNRYNAGYSAGAAAVSNGLNNPEGLQSANINTSFMNNNSGTTWLTFGRSGHFMVSITCDIQVRPAFGNSSVTCHVVGTYNYDKTLNVSNNDNSWSERENIMFGFIIHQDVAGGQSIGVNFDGWAANQDNEPCYITGAIHAHFVPTATYHN